MNAQFTHDEINLMCIYNPGSRKALIQELTHMKAFLERDEADLLALTESTINKLNRITDVEFEQIELIPDYDKEE